MHSLKAIEIHVATHWERLKARWHDHRHKWRLSSERNVVPGCLERERDRSDRMEVTERAMSREQRAHDKRVWRSSQRGSSVATALATHPGSAQIALGLRGSRNGTLDRVRSDREMRRGTFVGTEKERIAELWAAQTPAWVIHKEISRSRWAANGVRFAMSGTWSRGVSGFGSEATCAAADQRTGGNPVSAESRSLSLSFLSASARSPRHIAVFTRSFDAIHGRVRSPMR
jgi:hypothetical protein